MVIENQSERPTSRRASEVQGFEGQVARKRMSQISQPEVDEENHTKRVSILSQVDKEKLMKKDLQSISDTEEGSKLYSVNQSELS